jgi:hypothetical protein
VLTGWSRNHPEKAKTVGPARGLPRPMDAWGVAGCRNARRQAHWKGLGWADAIASRPIFKLVRNDSVLGLLALRHSFDFICPFWFWLSLSLDRPEQIVEHDAIPAKLWR